MGRKSLYTDAQKEIISDIRRMKTNISRRLANIYYKYEEDTIGLKVYHRFHRKMEDAFYRMSDEGDRLERIKISPETSMSDLRKIQKSLYRLDARRATKVKDFELYVETIYEAISTGVSLEEVFELYDKLVEDNGLLANYKYEIVQKIVEYKNADMSDQEIADYIHSMYEHMVVNPQKTTFKQAINEVEYEKFYDYEYVFKPYK